MILLYVSVYIVPLHLFSHDDCILYKSTLHYHFLRIFQSSSTPQTFLEKFNLYVTSTDPNEVLISDRSISKMIKIATVEYSILVYSYGCQNIFLRPYYVILINFNFNISIS